MAFQSDTKCQIREDSAATEMPPHPTRQPSSLFFFRNASSISWHNGSCSGVLRAASLGILPGVRAR